MPYKNTGEWVADQYHNETENSVSRRGKHFFEKYLKGKRVIDIGSGYDTITTNSYQYDRVHNEKFDATFVKEIADESFAVRTTAVRVDRVRKYNARLRIEAQKRGIHFLESDWENFVYA